MKIETIVIIATSLPLIALFYSIVIPLTLDYGYVTHTHCKAKNFLPSLSASISYSPQTSVIWFLCILLHTPFRFMLAKRLNETYKKLFAKIYTYEFLSATSNSEYNMFLRYRRMIFFAHQFNRLEVVGLLILSIFTSYSNFEMHKSGFVIYLFSSFVFTILVCKIEKKLKSERMLNLFDIKSKLAASYMTFFGLSIIFYLWHNIYCPDYVYSFFGFSEVVMILSNIFFHAWSYFLIKDLPIEISQI